MTSWCRIIWKFWLWNKTFFKKFTIYNHTNGAAEIARVQFCTIRKLLLYSQSPCRKFLGKGSYLRCYIRISAASNTLFIKALIRKMSWQGKSNSWPHICGSQDDCGQSFAVLVDKKISVVISMLWWLFNWFLLWASNKQS